MRYFITASVLVAGAFAHTSTEYLKCASASFGSADTSAFADCEGKSPQECFCSNQEALTANAAASPACRGVNLRTLTGGLCPAPEESTDSEGTPARHASRPMEPVKRAFAPVADADAASAAAAVPRVVYVTETKTDCSCKSTPAPYAKAHVSQIPVDVPASSSYMGGMMAASTPASYAHGIMGAAATPASYSHGIMGAASSAATPSPSGADPHRFSPFQGAAPGGVSVHGGVAAVGVAAVMAFMAAL